MTRFLPDTNVWLALILSGHPLHRRATTWWESVAANDEVVLCRATQQSLLRLLTTAAVFAPYGDEPLSNRLAWAALDEIAADPCVTLTAIEPSDVASAWRAHSTVTSASPKLWMDAYLAAFAKTSHAVLVTNDAAFRAYMDLDLMVIGAP
ncbi:MAG: PIN domain-containing protein [Microbacterium sp.]